MIFKNRATKIVAWKVSYKFFFLFLSLSIAPAIDVTITDVVSCRSLRSSHSYLDLGLGRKCLDCALCF